MEEINRNKHIIKNIISVIEKMEDEQKIRDFINQMESSTYSKMGIYKECIDNLKALSLSSLKGQKYVCEIKKICQYYLEYAVGKRFNKTKYDNDYRKEHYKQLNVDVPKDKMETFENILKENKTTKKKVILDFIDDYIKKEEEN